MTELSAFTIGNSCACEDEQGQLFDCGGDCVTADFELVEEEAAAWVDRNPSDHGYLIEGTGMGWTKASGERDWDGREPLYRTVGVDSAWTQHYEFDAAEIRITQSHHDAMGERYTVRAKTSDEA
jgi:hypothetical protein